MSPHRLSERLFTSTLRELSDLELATLLVGAVAGDDPGRSGARRLMDCLAEGHRPSRRTLLQSGFDEGAALAIAAAWQLFDRVAPAQIAPGRSFGNSQAVFQFFRPRMCGLKKECFWVPLLDGKNRFMRLSRISEGSLTASLVHPREVFRPAVVAAAAAILCVHNHPSGDPTPSREDVGMTRRLVETGKIVGIPVLDHLIIGRDAYFSFADEGIL